MKILRFAWKNYRNLPEGEILPCGSVNIISGKNAQGKTNLLEGMWLFTGERSFRRAKDTEMIRAGCDKSLLHLDFFGSGREQSAQIRISEGRRHAELNQVPKKSCAALIGEFRAAVFSPDHLSLMKGGPSGRRNFVDAALCQIRPVYAAVLAEYGRALAQRNALLKDIPRHADLLETLDVWDGRLAVCGRKIMRWREAYLQKLTEPARRFYSGICSGREEFSMKYEKNAPDLAVALAESRGRDLAAGHTCAGPHRDDIAVMISGMDARAYGSQGQKRSAVIALKLAEAQLLTENTGEKPVIFLDDVLSELDADRQSYLLNRLDGFQVFITCCEPDTMCTASRGKVFHMEQGRPSANGEES